MNETAAAGLGALVKARRCVDIVYMDDGHTFEDKITEIAFSYRLLRLGGVLARACRPSNPRVRLSYASVHRRPALVSRVSQFMMRVWRPCRRRWCTRRETSASGQSTSLKRHPTSCCSSSGTRIGRTVQTAIRGTASLTFDGMDDGRCWSLRSLRSLRGRCGSEKSGHQRENDETEIRPRERTKPVFTRCSEEHGGRGR